MASLSSDVQVALVVDGGHATLVVHVGQSFSRDLRVQPPAMVQQMADGRRSNTALIVLGYADAIISDFNRDWLRVHGGQEAPADLVIRAWYNPNLESRDSSCQESSPC